jgi:chromosome segregation ATPase
VVLALVAVGAWGAMQNKRLQQAEKAMVSYEVRISELEKRLSITGEDMNDSQLSMQVKMREMDSEIRKLWDNVWKKSKAQLAKHDATLNKHESFITGAKKQLSANDSVIKSLKTQLAKAGKVQTTVASNQKKLVVQESSLEATSDKVNRVSSDMNKLNRRVEETEEWVESINGFRKQVNRDVGALKKSVGQLQSKSTGSPAQ